MVDEFDWKRVGKTLSSITRAEAAAYASETGKKVEHKIYYWSAIGRGMIDIDEKRFLLNKGLARGLICPLDHPDQGIKTGDFYLSVEDANGFRPHARRICEEYERQLKYRTFLRLW